MPRRSLALAIALMSTLASARPAAAQTPPIRESWDAIYAGGSKIGSIHLWISPVKDAKGRELLNVRVDWELTFRRGRDTTTTKMQYGTIELPDGQVLRLETRIRASDQDIRSFGDVIDGALHLTMEVAGQKQRSDVPWGPEIRGPYGAEMSLSRQPIKPGETRAVKTYQPEMNQVCTATLKAVDFENVPLGPEAIPHRLLRVEQSLADASGKPQPTMSSTLWIDDSGQILKSYTGVLGGLTTFRTTRAGAQAAGGAAGPIDLFSKTLATPQPIANSERSRRVVYRLRGPGLAELIPADHRQALRLEGDGSAILEVTSDSPSGGAAGAATVDDEYLRPNPLINSQDPQVAKLARAAVGNRTDPWERAAAIQEWVFRNMKRKNFSTAFAPAAEVARDLSGDCTEHGVLTAAMCRSAGIPSRCVVGLVYANNIGGTGRYGFGPHLWNEVYVNGRWVAIDSAFNQSEVDATHIKLAETSMGGVAPLHDFLPVLQALDNLKIEPLEIR